MHIPSYIPVLFSITVFLTLAILNFSIDKSSLKNRRSILFLLIVLAWLIIQAIISLKNFYISHLHDMPPRMIFLVGPPMLLILLIFTTKKGNAFVDRLSPVYLTWLHIVRIPVEITLYLLCIHKMLPGVMTFAGRNFDILAGITAPFIAYFGLQKKMISKKFILIWNFIALGLLFNIVVTAILSAPFPFQKLGFDHPNIAVLLFPFTWLPGFVVPAVFFSHLVCIRQLLKKP